MWGEAAGARWRQRRPRSRQQRVRMGPCVGAPPPPPCRPPPPPTPLQWFTKAGFENVKLKRIGPSWYRGVRRHGLIMGCRRAGVHHARRLPACHPCQPALDDPPPPTCPPRSVTGVKPRAGASPLELGPKAEASTSANTNALSFLLRLLVGTLGGFWYFLVPIYMYIKNLVWPKRGPLADAF